MAEGALISVVASIVRVLGTPAFKELGNFWGHKKKFEKLENTMSLLEAVIQDAEAKQVNSRQIKHWLERLEDAVYEVDNLLDEFQTEALRSQAMPGHETTEKVRTFLSNSNPIAFQVKMGVKLRKVRKTLKGIKDDSVFGMLTHQLPLEPDAQHANNRETHSFVRDEEVIGRDGDKMNIIKLLLGPDSQDKDNVSFLPIVGIGGLGKTTLAQFVYNDEKIRKHFQLPIWVCISDVFDLKIIVEKMIKSINGSVQQGLELDQLQKSLRQKLSGKRYLLVLDDVWNEDREKWLKLKALLMDGSLGSAVLITTRNMHIAQMMQTIEPYELQGLDKNKSWSLFRKVAFEREQEPYNSNILRIAKEIVEMCKGVPLTIRTIGSILYGNNLESDWVSFKINKLAKLAQHQNDLLPTLRLSYDCLASHLKQCFAYCRLFPKDYEIDVQKLIKLWMAQGFVKSSDQNECLEDIGYGYFVYLIRRSFFQEVMKDGLGTIVTCKMHDLMHDLAISVVGKHSIIIDKHPENENFHQKIRHISVEYWWYSSKFPMSIFEGKELVRTFLGRGGGRSDRFSEKECEAILSNLKCIRALGLENFNMVRVPNNFDQVKHLRYIDLSCNHMVELPSSITRLYNLQTLILTDCSWLLSLPQNLKYMISLRHLLIDGCDSLTHIPSGLGELTSLMTLDRFFMAENSSKWEDAAGFAELSHLNNLRGKLVIEELSHNLHGDDAAKSKGANLKEKQHLQSLHLLWRSNNDADDGGDIAEHDEILLHGLQPHPNLKAFRVEWYMGVKFASWLSSLSNLVSLHLAYCKNLQYLPSLDQSMSYLKELKLYELIALEYVNLESEYSRALFFPRLERLEISYCPNLKGWWKRSGPNGLAPTTISSMIHQNQNQPFFPFLLHLAIHNCPNLTSMPLFPNVEYLRLSNTSSIPLQQTAVLMKAVASPNSLTPPLELESTSSSSSSDSFFNSSAPTIPLYRLDYLYLHRTNDLEILPEGIFCSVLTCLHIGDCRNLVNLPEEIAKLSSSLQKLYIEDCPSLTSLPKGIGNLSALDTLDIGRCDRLESLPEEMHGLVSLAAINIFGCFNLGSLPEGISNLSSLSTLSIKDCCMLVSLPQGMHGLTSLKYLHVEECPYLKSLPEGIGNLSSLECLTLKRCARLASLPQGLHGLTSLKNLSIEECPSLEALSPITNNQR